MACIHPATLRGVTKQHVHTTRALALPTLARGGGVWGNAWPTVLDGIL